jgi:hypothetical protein
MSERAQNVSPRQRRPAPRAATRGTSVAKKRRAVDFGRVLRRAAVLLAVALPLAGGYFAATSGVFRLKRVEVVGATKTPTERIEQVVKAAAGGQLLLADLDVVRKAVLAERAVQSVTIARVLPDTIRVRVEEREPAVVVRLASGQLAWADANGHVVSDFKPEGGEVPPPLTGFEDGDSSERAAADNRDRVATYGALRDALAGDKLWDWVDEVNLRYPKDAQVRLVDGGVLVRLGGEQFRERMTRALLVIDAAKRGDADALRRMNITDADTERMIASPDIISRVDATPSSKMTIAFRKVGGGDAGRN